jgi:Trp operon repressor
MKIKKFIKNIKDFFDENKNEYDLILQILEELEDKKSSLNKKLSNSNLDKNEKENLKNNIKIVDELIAKIEKKREKLDRKLT